MAVAGSGAGRGIETATLSDAQSWGQRPRVLPLASHLDEQQPVYALQARGLDGQIASGRSVEEMVTSYLAEIRSLQSEGPYFLGGYCSGGVLAWEAARQLAVGRRESRAVGHDPNVPSCLRALQAGD